MSQDFYQTLGIEKTSTESEIKKAYRKQAVKWHPDKNPGNEEQASSMFKKIGEAYETLGDPSKRSQYDNGGIDYNDINNNMRRNSGTNRSQHQQNFSSFSDRRAHDIFAAFFNDSGMGDLFNDPFFSNGFGSSRQQNNGGQQQQRNRDPFASMMMDPFSGFGGMGGGFGDMGGDFSSQSSFASCSSFSGGAGRSGKSTSTSTFIGPDGKRITKRETTTYHPDGTSETTVETDEGHGRISGGRDAPRIASSRNNNGGKSSRYR
jgi:curved DNA-binding protein CbpA